MRLRFGIPLSTSQLGVQVLHSSVTLSTVASPWDNQAVEWGTTRPSYSSTHPFPSDTQGSALPDSDVLSLSLEFSPESLTSLGEKWLM